ncbi:SAM-dependent methyltransferase [Nonomuraea sp. NPDC050536]|uniref:SAM-dependent methyltransferase n=1 Tax=Nonomuraea sp. NPDC050536 TaxID=3364366 RepID=UPI0037C52119
MLPLLSVHPTDSPESQAPGDTPPRLSRLLDAVSGGKNHTLADMALLHRLDYFARGSISRALRAIPGWLADMVGNVVREGIDQLVVIGSGVPGGLPPGGQLHDIAHRVDPRAHVIYVEDDPVISAYAPVTVAAGNDRVRTIPGLLEAPQTLLINLRMNTLIDWDRPLGLLVCWPPELNDPSHCRYILTSLRRRLPSGSRLAIARLGVDDEFCALPYSSAGRWLGPHHLPARHALVQALQNLDLLDVEVVRLIPAHHPVTLYGSTAMAG